jgi:WD40 repeat protein
LAVAFDVAPFVIDLWDLQGNDPAARHVAFRGHKDTVRELVFTPNSRWMATAGDDSTVRLWHLTAPSPPTSSLLLPGAQHITAVAPDSCWLVTRDRHALRAWDLQAADPAAASFVLGPLEKDIRTALITADSRWLVTHGENKTVRCWDIRIRKK